VPETYLIGRDGTIAYKLVGPVTADNLARVLEPEITKATAR
jgi:cytochrome c biogenesis protein CcmG/thiol:disulfide interchange protein DsbE